MKWEIIHLKWKLLYAASSFPEKLKTIHHYCFHTWQILRLINFFDWMLKSWVCKCENSSGRSSPRGVQWLVGELCVMEWVGISRTPDGNTGWKVTAVCQWWEGGSRFPSQFGSVAPSLPCPSSGYPLSLTHSPSGPLPQCCSRLRASQFPQWWPTAPSAASSGRWGAGWRRSDASWCSQGRTAAASHRLRPLMAGRKRGQF